MDVLKLVPVQAALPSSAQGKASYVKIHIGGNMVARGRGTAGHSDLLHP